MAHDRIDLGLIRDDGIRRQLRVAQRDGKLSDAEVTKIIDAALADQAGDSKLDEQEVKDLLAIADRSVTMSPSAKNRIRKTVLLEYTRHRIRDDKMGQALRLALADNVLTRKELENVVRQALDKEKDARGRSVVLSPYEINDLLLLAKSVPPDFREYVLSMLSQNVRPAAPPATVPTPKLFEVDGQDKGGQYKVPVRILKDSTPDVSIEDVLPPSDEEYAVEKLTVGKNPDPGEARTHVSVEFGDGRYTFGGSGKAIKVIGVTRWPRTLRINIGILYGLGARSTTRAGYGRGTTDDDIRSGRITLGWHEHCHREAAINFLRRNPLPRFNGAVGQPKAVFLKHRDDYKEAIKRYLEMEEKESVRLVDEVGYKRSEYCSKHKCEA